MSRFHDILVPVDFSETSDDALSLAAELSRAYHATVHVLHVVPRVVPSLYAMNEVGFDFSAYVREAMESARLQLPALAARHQIDPALLTTVVLHGGPADEIVRYAERVTRRAPCAILMVPHVVRRGTPFDAEAAAGARS